MIRGFPLHQRAKAIPNDDDDDDDDSTRFEITRKILQANKAYQRNACISSLFFQHHKVRIVQLVKWISITAYLVILGFLSWDIIVGSFLPREGEVESTTNLTEQDSIMISLNLSFNLLFNVWIFLCGAFYVWFRWHMIEPIFQLYSENGVVLTGKVVGSTTKNRFSPLFSSAAAFVIYRPYHHLRSDVPTTTTSTTTQKATSTKSRGKKSAHGSRTTDNQKDDDHDDQDDLDGSSLVRESSITIGKQIHLTDVQPTFDDEMLLVILPESPASAISLETLNFHKRNDPSYLIAIFVCCCFALGSLQLLYTLRLLKRWAHPPGGVYWVCHGSVTLLAIVRAYLLVQLERNNILDGGATQIPSDMMSSQFLYRFNIMTSSSSSSLFATERRDLVAVHSELHSDPVQEAHRNSLLGTATKRGSQLAGGTIV